MDEKPNKPVYDLEERTFQFAKQVWLWIKNLPKTIGNTEDMKPLVCASDSIEANYIEANESLCKKNFFSNNRKIRRCCLEFWVLKF